MTYVCERCRHHTELFYCRSVDEYLCDNCLSQLTEPENTEDD